MKRTAALLVFCITTAALAQDTTPAKPWNSNLGAGLAITSGNTNTRSYNLSFGTKYDPKTRFVFKADALYLRASSDGVRQVDKASADARGEFSVSDRTFAFGEVTYLRDPFKAITYLVAPVAGGGYRLIKSDRRNLTVDAALGGQVESNPTLGRTTSAVLKGGENFDWALSPTSKFTQKLTGLWKTSDFADALYHFDAALSAAVLTRMELKFGYTFDYKTRPVPNTLKKGDSALVAALVLKF